MHTCRYKSINLSVFDSRRMKPSASATARETASGAAPRDPRPQGTLGPKGPSAARDPRPPGSFGPQGP